MMGHHEEHERPEAVAHGGLLDVAKLSHRYIANLAGFGARRPPGGACKRVFDRHAELR